MSLNNDNRQYINDFIMGIDNNNNNTNNDLNYRLHKKQNNILSIKKTMTIQLPFIKSMNHKQSSNKRIRVMKQNRNNNQEKRERNKAFIYLFKESFRKNKVVFIISKRD